MREGRCNYYIWSPRLLRYKSQPLVRRWGHGENFSPNADLCVGSSEETGAYFRTTSDTQRPFEDHLGHLGAIAIVSPSYHKGYLDNLAPLGQDQAVLTLSRRYSGNNILVLGGPECRKSIHP